MLWESFFPESKTPKYPHWEIQNYHFGRLFTDNITLIFTAGTEIPLPGSAWLPEFLLPVPLAHAVAPNCRNPNLGSSARHGIASPSTLRDISAHLPLQTSSPPNALGVYLLAQRPAPLKIGELPPSAPCSVSSRSAPPRPKRGHTQTIASASKRLPALPL